MSKSIVIMMNFSPAILCQANAAAILETHISGLSDSSSRLFLRDLDDLEGDGSKFSLKEIEP